MCRPRSSAWPMGPERSAGKQSGEQSPARWVAALIPGGAVLAAGLVLGLQARADFDGDAFPPHERCALCHGLFGVSANARFPNLGGQEPVYLENQIHAFLGGTRHNDGGQMVSIVTELQPDDIPRVVEWFASQDPPAPTGDGNARGKALFDEMHCAACHNSDIAYLGVPHLTAQHEAYLVKQMTEFRDGVRETHEGCLPHGPMMPKADADIADIAAYLAAEPRR